MIQQEKSYLDKTIVRLADKTGHLYLGKLFKVFGAALSSNLNLVNGFQRASGLSTCFVTNTGHCSICSTRMHGTHVTKVVTYLPGRTRSG